MLLAILDMFIDIGAFRRSTHFFGDPTQLFDEVLCGNLVTGVLKICCGECACPAVELSLVRGGRVATVESQDRIKSGGF